MKSLLLRLAMDRDPEVLCIMEGIANNFERAGDKYLRDVVHLRSGSRLYNLRQAGIAKYLSMP
jgi:hypothetical protein